HSNLIDNISVLQQKFDDTRASLLEHLEKLDSAAL
ncbi:MAG: hypothetical protein ACI909_003552, partial [Planctomycetota bacterium]